MSEEEPPFLGCEAESGMEDWKEQRGGQAPSTGIPEVGLPLQEVNSGKAAGRYENEHHQGQITVRSKL